MATQSHVNFVSNQRLDVSDLRAIESYASFDLRTLCKMLTNTPKILHGYEISSILNGIAKVRVKSAIIIWPDHPNGAFLQLSDDAPDIEVNCYPAATTYVELDLLRKTTTPIARGIIDQTAITPETPLGVEIPMPIDSQNILYPSITASNVRNPARVLIAEITLNENFGLISIIDKRPMFGKLDAYEWSANRIDDHSFTTSNPSGILNDRGVPTLHDVLRALGTRLTEILGCANWYNDAQLPVRGLSMSNMFSLSERGMRFAPSSNTRIVWSASNNKRLNISATAPVAWHSNYSILSFELFGRFKSDTEHLAENVNDYTIDIALADNDVLYIPLEIDMIRAGDLPVTWVANGGPNSWNVNRVLFCATAAFQGVYIGDYVKRLDDGQSEYYQIVAASDGVEVLDAKGAAIELRRFVLLDRPITNAGVSKCRFVRQRYAVNELLKVPRTQSSSAAFSNYYYFCSRTGSNLHIQSIGWLTEGAIVSGSEPVRIPRRIVNTSIALDRYTHCAVCKTSTPITITLPPQLGDADSVLDGFEIRIKDEQGTAPDLVTIIAPNGGLIDGKTEYKLSIWEGVHIMADGAGNWSTI